jgi:hypothetical protein
MLGRIIQATTGRKALIGLGLLLVAQLGFVLVRTTSGIGLMVARSMPDLDPSAYDVARLREVLAYFHEHVGTTLTVYAIDVLLPFSNVLLFVSLIGLLLKRLGKAESAWRFAVLLPPLACLADYTENASVLALTFSGANTAGDGAVAWLRAATSTKFFLYIASAVATLILWIWFLVSRRLSHPR